MLKKIINNSVIFYTLLFTLLILSGCDKNNDTLPQTPQKNLTPAAQFNIATKASRPDSKEFGNVFGKGATWGIYDNISDPGKYKLEINLPKVSPRTQTTLDDFKNKAKPFTDKLLDEMEKVGIENPVMYLKIKVINGNIDMENKNLTTTYRITK
ncbi:hypothetical protein NH621_01355 [Lactococcus formosensis]|uniref:Lipoprotein n=1 Tax=Lactococcus garvieae TaxID=1363 RepID=A0AA46TW12_9LACT|nr:MULTISPECIES: hypothetical protein [Lactococcus]MCO7179832.1 hypothetical protein [Lactococcus formosensis]UYT10339.1 hypothetical protein OF801_10425 [Lactococcus garvieae]UYT12379.1 hypothetical protein OF800_10410 [Lactococcus garvieae]